MTLGDGAHASLDDLFRRAGVRAPSRLALLDPPDCARVTGRAPRALTFAETDRAIAALAARLSALGLATGTVVGLQLANTVESVVALLGLLRAGMVAAPLPLLWRRQDTVAALGRAGAKAIICAPATADAAMQSAAELFPIRYVCGFGDGLPDGVVPLDEVFAPAAATVQPSPRAGKADERIALVSFDVTAGGTVPVVRSHRDIVTAGLDIARAADLGADMNLLCALVPGTFAPVALGIVPWLLTGGTLALHQPFDPQIWRAQCEALGSCAVVVPGPVLQPLCDAKLIHASVTAAIALWRAPERLADAPAWRGTAKLVDVVGADENSLTPVPRDTVAVPPPAGIATVGGYRFGLRALEADIESIDPEAALLALPDALMGERLVGTAAHPETVCSALEARGANPLICGAFRARNAA
jgi:acyl-CoA synthetase (AMP-forming)/AMP-acid ligase II